MATFQRLSENVTFGVEIECLLPVNGHVVNCGPRHAGYKVPELPGQRPNTFWKAEGDSSVIANRNYYGLEFVSPVLQGVAGLQNLVKTLAQIREWGGKVNATCGFHVHIGWTSEKIADLKKVTAFTAQYQDAFYAASGTRRRETGIYCKPIKGYERLDWNAGRIRDGRCGKVLSMSGLHDRYMLLNLENLLMGTGKPTIEFRVFSGTVNAVKAVSYVRMALAAYDCGMNIPRCVKWSVDEGRSGRVAMRRFFYWAGWTKKGKLASQGLWNAGDLMGEGLPTMEQTMKELFRLACKYDGVPVEAVEPEADVLPRATTERQAARLEGGNYGEATPPTPAV